MICRVEDLREKDVIEIKNGICLGSVDDVQIDICSAKVLSLVIFGRCKFFGLLGREDDIIIKWDEIKIIGEDAVLVCLTGCNNLKDRKKGRKKKIFKIFS